MDCTNAGIELVSKKKVLQSDQLMDNTDAKSSLACQCKNVKCKCHVNEFENVPSSTQVKMFKYLFDCALGYWKRKWVVRNSY